MLKEHGQSVTRVQKLIDVSAVLLSWYCSYYFRFQTSLIPEAQTGMTGTYLKWGLVLIPTTLYFFTQHKLYHSMRFTSRFEEILSLVKANFLNFIAFVIVIYFFANFRVSRVTLLTFLLLSTSVLIMLRISVRNYLRILRKQGKNLRYALLIGGGHQSEEFVHKISKFKDSGIKIAYWDQSEGLNQKYDIQESNLNPYELYESGSIDTIIIGFSTKQTEKLNDFLAEIKDEIIPTLYLPEFKYSFVGLTISDFAGIPIIRMNEPNISNRALFIKRMLDIVSTSFGLLLISPILLIIGILVKITSPGPIFYRQKRLGLDGRTFEMWKFRSMKVQSGNEEKPGWTVKNDPRKTKFGNFIRKTSLDELPQLWNVLRGDMSLVGPRPEQPHFVNKFKKEIPKYMLRHKMKAGITGWAQVNGWRGDTSIEKRIECDIYYINHWSLWLDIKIIFLTFWKGFINKNAY